MTAPSRQPPGLPAMDGGRREPRLPLASPSETAPRTEARGDRTSRKPSGVQSRRPRVAANAALAPPDRSAPSWLS